MPDRRAALHALFAATASALAACGGGGGAPAGVQQPPPPPPPPPGSITITRRTATANPTGLKIGFWEDNGLQDVTLGVLGRRPVSRVGFTAWNQVELSPGVYDWPPFTLHTLAHRYGETVMAAVNISFNNLLTPGSGTIPSFYVDDITNPQTRSAAKAFLAAFVKELLQSIGNVWLTIDYEVVTQWHLDIAGSESRAAIWSAWYVEAAGVARQAAADIGLSSRLKLQPIVNGDPLRASNPIGAGAASNAWLINVVNASDALACDTYYSDPSLPVTNPQRTIDTIQFWIEQFSQGKPMHVTENGFTSVTSIDASITRDVRDQKYTGTEAQQAAYFGALFPRLIAANAAGGVFRNQLRAFQIWAIVDNGAQAVGTAERYFGLIDTSGRHKAALTDVQAGISDIETDAFHTPITVSAATDDFSTDLLAGSASATLAFNAGDDFQFLRYVEGALSSASRYTLRVAFSAPANVIVSVNGTLWLADSQVSSTALDVTSACVPGATCTIDVYVTDDIFPSSTTVTSLRLDRA